MENPHQKAETYLQTLCLDIPNRRLGSQGNQAATDFVNKAFRGLGLPVETQRFDCLDYKAGAIRLTVGGTDFPAHISPYSLGCDVTAELAAAASLDDLHSVDYQGKVLLLTGELVKEQLMPRKYVFYNPDSHKDFHRLLDIQQPAAIIAATGRNPDLAGAPYPFSLIEDGDFEIPAAYMTDVEGSRLIKYIGQIAALKLDSERIPSWGENVIVRIGPEKKERLAVCAHIDTKDNTPGAADNASGVVVLLLLADLLKDEKLDIPVELIVMNGEDHYSAGGELTYLDLHENQLDKIRLMVNIDGAGFIGHSTGVSFYECPDSYRNFALEMLKDYPTIAQGEPWYQSDHMVFAMKQVPAMAITTIAFAEMLGEVAHTPKDNPQVVDVSLLVEIAQFLCELLTGKGLQQS